MTVTLPAGIEPVGIIENLHSSTTPAKPPLPDRWVCEVLGLPQWCHFWERCSETAEAGQTDSPVMGGDGGCLWGMWHATYPTIGALCYIIEIAILP